MLDFNTNIRFLKGVGEKKSAYLGMLGIDNVGALLRYYPRGYEQVGEAVRIIDCLVGEKLTVKAKIITPVTEHRIRAKMVLYKFNISDGTGVIAVTIFNNKYLAAALHQGSTYLFTGKIDANRYEICMNSPEIREENDLAIHPVYRANSHISSKQIEKLQKTAFSLITDIPESLPQSILKKHNLMPLCEALKQIHFPANEQYLEKAKHRLVFEELFILSTGLSLLKGKKKKAAGVTINRNFTEEFLTLLPYSLTNAQNRTVEECINNMMSGTVMNRLIEGDVGSGKTAVAAACMYSVVKSGGQCAMMAPTEILAEQHFAYFNSLFKDTNINVALLTGSTKKKEKQEILEGLISGKIQIAVGTHALISPDVCYNSLGLVITDEQHRFGVSQRASLSEKGDGVHTLVMSATPIPRTLGLIIYGDLDLSVLDEYPRGRQKIDTYLVESSLRERVFGYIKKHLDAGLQGYIVCPMVEENEETNLKSAEEYYAEIKDGYFKNYSVGVLHGKMKAAEKDRIMREFKDKEIDLLVCTTVIEVGIDVPNAAIMVIENAERFGLSALHQLRGRVGRGTAKSCCILISDAKGSSKERLTVIKNSGDGFKIADEDLRLRGPGDFLGSRQHGLPELKIADIYADGEILKIASDSAKEVLLSDPALKCDCNLCVRNSVIELYRKLNEN